MTTAREFIKTTDTLDEAFRLLVRERKAQAKRRPAKKAVEPPPVPWSERALAWITATISGREFTSDDLVTALGSPPDGNGIGNLFHDASKKGLILDTGNTVASSNPKARGRRIRVWRSV